MAVPTIKHHPNVVSKDFTLKQFIMDQFEEDSDILLIAGSAVIVLLLLLANANKRRDRRMRVHPYLRERNTKGRFNTAVNI